MLNGLLYGLAYKSPDLSVWDLIQKHIWIGMRCREPEIAIGCRVMNDNYKKVTRTPSGSPNIEETFIKHLNIFGKSD
jgi:hypothetical protein